MSAPLQVGDTLATAASEAARRAAAHIARLQKPEGEWCAELTADSTLESDYILFQLWLYPPVNGVWEPRTRPQVDRAARSILKRQLPDGGFNIYKEGPSEISVSVKAYFSLKLAGLTADDSRMVRLRERIMAMGGIQAANSYVKINLSLFDLYPREHCPSIPPEVALLPFNVLYQMSSWSRTIVVPLAIVHSADPHRPVPVGFNLDELWDPSVSPSVRLNRQIGWLNLFLTIDRLLKWWERSGSKAVRRIAVERAKKWMLERLHPFDGVGGVYPPMMCLGVGAQRLEGRPPNRCREGQEMDARAARPFRWAGRDLSADDVFGDGARCPRFRAQPPDTRRGAASIRRLNGGRWRAVLHSTVFLAGLGYGHRLLCHR